MESVPAAAALTAPAPATSASPALNSEYELRRHVYNELINTLYRQLPLSSSSTMAVVAIMVTAMWDHVPTQWLLTWLVLMTVHQASRVYLYFMFRANKLQKYAIRWRARIWTSGAIISGVLWGSTAIFFHTPVSMAHQAILMVLVLGAATAGVPLIASHLASLYGFLVPALTPFIFRHLLVGDSAHVALGLILLAVTLSLLSFGGNYHRLILGSLRNRFETEVLANQLTRQNVDLEQARVVAEQANRSKTQFFAAASHDLRQPLHALGLFASALAQKVHAPEAAKLVTSVNDSVQALEALFNELLDISKLDSGVIKPNVTPLRLDDIFNRLRSGFVEEATAKQLCLSIAPAPFVVISDSVLLERILRNLISNAIRYTPAGEISVTATPADGKLRIAVLDTGIGIREHDQQRIFEEFFQVGNPGRTSKKGLGLGLAIVQRLCTLLGYTIHLQSEYGKGTEFSFEVALGMASARTGAAAPAPADGAQDLSGKLVVVIDDESAIIEAMTALFNGWGAEVIASTTGEEVIAAVHEKGKMPDLLMVDFRLSGEDTGIELARRIRQELDPEIPAILVTGSITPELADQARAANMEFLLKPATATLVLECVSRVFKLNPTGA